MATDCVSGQINGIRGSTVHRSNHTQAAVSKSRMIKTPSQLHVGLGCRNSQELLSAEF